MDLQGLKVVSTVAAFVLASVTMSVLIGGTVGIDLSTGSIGESDVSSVGEELNPNARGTGTQDPSTFGISVGVTETLNVIWMLTLGLDDLLMSYSVPAVAARSIQMLATIAVALAALAIFRGFRF
jgi:hypothetical protein